MASIDNVKFTKLKGKGIVGVTLYECEIDSPEECNFEDTIFQQCILKGIWKHNNHKQKTQQEIFALCDHKEEHEHSAFGNVKDFEKIKDKQKDCSNDMDLPIIG